MKQSETNREETKNIEDMKKKVIIATVLVLVAGAATWMLVGKSPQKKVTFENTTVTRGNISTSVTATGTVEPVTQVEVGTQVSGIVNKLYVDYNSVVKKGQVIAELDKTNLLNDLASKRAALGSAKTEYEYQTKNYNRSKTLHEKTLISDTDYETALYNFQRSRNSYDIAKNDVAKSETNLGYATITSPIDGVVLSRSVEEGQTVASSFNTPTLFIIANDLTDMQVVANVDEADIGGVRDSLHVTFTVDTYPNDTFEGVVTQVRQEATTTSNVVTYEVVISAPNPDLKLKPGLTANITIFTQEKDNVLCVPSKALRFTPDKLLIGTNDKVSDAPQAAHKLWTYDGSSFVAHPVEIGTNNGMMTEIISGVPEGIKVVADATAGKAPASEAVQEEQSGDKSPFMPSHPGQKKK